MWAPRYLEVPVSSRQTRFRWLCGYLFPAWGRTDLARATPLEVTPTLHQADSVEISVLKRFPFVPLAVPWQITGERLLHGAGIARRTRTGHSAGTPMFTWATPESAFLTGNRPGNRDFRS